MPIDYEKRSTNARINGSKSRGPVTRFGKEIARRSALVHGGHARVLTMDSEPADLIESTYARWREFYQPCSPAAEHFMTLCIQSKICGDRVQRSHDAITQSQTDAAAALYAQNRADLIARQMDLLATHPAAAAQGLLGTSQGCRAAAERFRQLQTRFLDQGFWGAEVGDAVRLMGVVPSLEGLRDDPDAFLLTYCNLQCRLGGGGGAPLETLMRPEHRPAEITDAMLAELAGPAAARPWILGFIHNWLAELEQLAVRLQEKDWAEREQVVAPNLIIVDDREFQKYTRLRSQTTSAFLRAYKALEETLKRDAAADHEESVAALAEGKAERRNEPTNVPAAAGGAGCAARTAGTTGTAATAPAAAGPTLVSSECDKRPPERPRQARDGDRHDRCAVPPANGPPRGT
jgi:hypothetical protein